MQSGRTSWGLDENEGCRLEFATRGRMESKSLVDKPRGLGEVDW